ncbi:hypothetical protein NE237_000245 [Protea cynaroides]|uniref:Uncharacterized protein n=1 Tax=Protea cynaroides TaxID=273540 RepID=A0A9Q0KR67_9MAGN|nr:hypothetical protein NE237_000245 [Protea cynaroides]
MWHLLTTMKRSLWNMKKSARVADENMVADGVDGAELPAILARADTVRDHRSRQQNGLSILYSVIRAPLSLISCISNPSVNGADGVWVSGEFTARMSEINHLMVNEGMRYAILM